MYRNFCAPFFNYPINNSKNNFNLEIPFKENLRKILESIAMSPFHPIFFFLRFISGLFQILNTSSKNNFLDNMGSELSH